MGRKLKVVFDTNIYVSAILFGGNPRQCLELARAGEFELYTTRAILFELAKKLQEKFLWKGVEVEETIGGVLVFTKIVLPKKKIHIINEDPKDNRILECAQVAKADYIVSGNKKHLLSLRTFQNIPIISAKQFLDILYGKS